MEDADPVEIVKLASTFYRSPSRRLQVARDRFGLSMTGYAAVLNRALDDPAVALAAPVEVARLRRLREQRTAVRSARRSA